MSVLSDANAPLDGKDLNIEPVRDLTFSVLDSACHTNMILLTKVKVL